MKKNRYEMCGLNRRMKKLLFVMKLTILAFFFGLMSLSASTYSQNKKITLDLQGVSLVDVFKQIEAQSEFVFIYKNEAINVDKKVDVKAEGSTIDLILENLLQNSGVKYEINKKQIIITPDRSISSNNEIKTNEGIQQPQKKELSGTVKDSKGVPLPGVTVMVKGTTIGTITDNDGKFKFSVFPDAKTIVFSFIGMKTQEMPITGKTSFNVVMEEEAVAMNDVVVVGYGVQKKESVVGAITQVNSQSLMRSGSSNVTNAIAGKLSGVLTIQQSGEPGSNNSEIIIRGLSSWNGSAPLVLVDGVERDFNSLDPNEINTISVLKDASATAVFGAKGANGVIIVTTKRGKIGKPQLDFFCLVRTSESDYDSGLYQFLYDDVNAQYCLYEHGHISEPSASECTGAVS